ncbi:MAG: reductase DrgA [Nitrosomonadaceae bacterium]|nr:reductase DrgA [Nitrosomonadaceae bacterium]|tara:strand:+ start:17 stop:619 length:603 start_codon:yes stop_codon:yes gene_type:complete
MDVSVAINSRRAIKSFDPNHRMNKAEIEQLMTLSLLAPTSFNIQNWRFVLVQDPELRCQIRAVSWDQPQVTDSSLLVILTADLQSWSKKPIRYWEGAPQSVQEFILPAIEKYYSGNAQVQRDEGMRSCGIAAMALMLAAEEMGYASCPMVGFDFERVGKIINLPTDHVITMFVAIGKSTKGAWARSGKLTMDEAVIIDRF